MSSSVNNGQSGIPRVVVILETSFGASRSRFQGILQYVRRRGPWHLDYAVGGTGEQKIPADSIDRYDGVIARNPDEAVAKSLADLPVPVVLIDPEYETQKYPKLATLSQVTLDNAAVGRLAAKYFIDNGHTNFAFIEPQPPRQWALYRKQAFTEAVRAVGSTVHSFGTSPGIVFSESNRKCLAAWLEQLPKPIAVLGASDIEARHVIDACLLQGIPVPYHCAVLGVGNDLLVCQSCFPSLSSIDIHWEDAGFAAASLLDEEMKQPARAKQSLSYRPGKVVERLSTEPGPITDSLIIRILEQIRLCSGFNIRVGELARELQVTRQWLEKRFKQSVGHSIMEEIQKRRFEKISSLVGQTDLSFNEIAQLCGFQNGTYLRTLFKKELGVTMSEYRNKARAMEQD